MSKSEIIKRIRESIKGTSPVSAIFLYDGVYRVYLKDELKIISLQQVLNVLAAYPETPIFQFFIWKESETEINIPIELRGAIVYNISMDNEATIFEMIELKNKCPGNILLESGLNPIHDYDLAV